MKLNRNELLKAIAVVKPGIASKEIIQQMVHIIFMGDYIASYNDNISVIAPFKTDFKTSVHGEEFYKAIDIVNEEEVDISIDKALLKIKSKRTKAGMSTIVGENEKVEERITDLIARTNAKRFWKTLPEDFLAGVSLCMFCTDKDMTRGVTTCIAVKGGELFSTDNFRASKYVMKNKMDDMFIPSISALHLVKYNVTKYGTSEGWIHFKTEDGILFNCKTMIGVYPFESMMDFFREPSDEIILPKELQEAMKAASAFAEGEVDIAKSVEITIEKNILTCRSEKDRGWIEKEIVLEKPVRKKLLFYINPIFLDQILNRTTSFFIASRKEDPEEPLPDKAIFTSENFQHVIALPTED